ncbi:MAG: toxin-antitoxin system YwqK family antitoxin [Flavobacteriales bacterium]
MKKIFITIIGLFIAAGLSAQCLTETSKTYVLEGERVKMERFNDSGDLVEVGYYLKDGTLDGKWVSYAADGSVLSEAYYAAGEKVGKWKHFDVHNNKVHFVSYEEGVLASSKTIDPVLVMED